MDFGQEIIEEGFGSNTEEQEDIINKTSLKKEEILIIGINPRESLSVEVINELAEFNSSEIPEILVGYTYDEIKFNNLDLKNKFFLVDGEHRLRSRKKDEDVNVKIKIYNNTEDIIIDSVRNNLHGRRLTKKEIEIAIYNHINRHFQGNLYDFEDKPSIKKLSKTFITNRKIIREILYKFILIQKTKKTNHDFFENVSRTIIYLLKDVIDKDKSYLINFLDNFSAIIRSSTFADKEKIEEIVSLFINEKICTMEEYMTLKRTTSLSSDIFGVPETKEYKENDEEFEDESLDREFSEKKEEKFSTVDMNKILKSFENMFNEKLTSIEKIKNTNKIVIEKTNKTTVENLEKSFKRFIDFVVTI